MNIRIWCLKGLFAELKALWEMRKYKKNEDGLVRKSTLSVQYWEDRRGTVKKRESQMTPTNNMLYLGALCAG